MLYITTRSNTDTFTSHRAMSTNTAPDGCHFVPFRMPSFSVDEIKELKDKPFNQIVADVLNIFFSAGITPWDVDFAIGKSATPALRYLNHRILVAELWHNPGNGIDYIAQRLYEKLCIGDNADKTAGTWAKTAVWIAVLFAVYGELLRNDLIAFTDSPDIVVPAEDFLIPMAAHYAKKMGLPINTVICACDETCNVWELIHKGTYATASRSASLNLGIERLIHSVYGTEEAIRFAKDCDASVTYTETPETVGTLSRGFYCAVAGKGRAEATINSVYRSSKYLIDPKTALCFCALQDYRAGTAISRTTLILAQSAPGSHLREISGATGVSEAELRKILNL